MFETQWTRPRAQRQLRPLVGMSRGTGHLYWGWGSKNCADPENRSPSPSPDGSPAFSFILSVIQHTRGGLVTTSTHRPAGQPCLGVLHPNSRLF